MSTRKKKKNNNNHYIDLCTIAAMCSMGQIAKINIIKIRDFIKCIKGQFYIIFCFKVKTFLGFHYESQVVAKLVTSTSSL